ncbi:MAG: hypothetical protein HC915_03210 [Anaerolineae bacterium]|nr:hypothetical protein [Anaerolineae bacterium]
MPAAQIEVLGWPQMDVYQQAGTCIARDAFLQDRLGLSPERRLVVLGAYTQRLAPYEAEVAQHIAAQARAGAYGLPVTLLVRPHPRDFQWAARFGALHAPPEVIVEPPDWGDLAHLANLMAHADVVLNSASTIMLDAVAFDTPVINLAWGAAQVPNPWEAPARMYEWDHLRAVVETGGTRLVQSTEALDQALLAYLHDPSIDAPGRARIRAEQLEPFDGRASERLVNWLQRTIQNPAQAGAPFFYPWSQP